MVVVSIIPVKSSQRVQAARVACGRILERSTVNTAFKAAAVALGLGPADHATHSLRAGGATALYAIGWPPSKTQRRGRWLSDCWLLYIWPDREQTPSAFILLDEPSGHFGNRQHPGVELDLTTELRILGGGPSCKAYSGAGKQQFHDDGRANGFRDTAEYLSSSS